MKNTSNTETRSPHFSRTWILAISGLFMALYIVVMYLTQSFAFGAYQIRIATGIYAFAYLFPFLIVPLGLSNFLSNTFFGGLGIYDMLGGLAVGLITTTLIYLIRRFKLPKWLIILPITIVPGFGVPLYLQFLIGVPYWVLVGSLLLGQFISGVVGYLLVIAFEKTKLV